MAMTEEFTEAVSNKKMLRVRIMLKDIMLVDTSMKSFDEMAEYAEGNLSGLYDEHNGEKLLENPADWTEDYMNHQMVSVVSNFSKERIDLLKKIVKKLYGDKTITEDAGEMNPSENAEHTQDDKLNTGLTGQKLLGAALVVAGGLALAGGLYASSVPAAVGGGIAAVGGAALIMADRRK